MRNRGKWRILTSGTGVSRCWRCSLGDGGGIEMGGAEVVREDGIGKVETREEERILGWRDACARVVCAG